MRIGFIGVVSTNRMALFTVMPVSMMMDILALLLGLHVFGQGSRVDGRFGPCLLHGTRVPAKIHKPATRGLLRLGSRFFADFLWRSKESQRGALPLSATDSKKAPTVEIKAHAVAILIFSFRIPAH